MNKNKKHEKLIEILRAAGKDRKDLNLISQLYWNQTAEVRIEQSTSETTKIKRG